MKTFQWFGIVLALLLAGPLHAGNEYAHARCWVNVKAHEERGCSSHAGKPAWADVLATDQNACDYAKKQARNSLKEKMPSQCERYISCEDKCLIIAK